MSPGPDRGDRAPGEALDVTGLLCPLPVLKIKKRLSAMSPGDTLDVVATDPATRIDVPHFCAEAGHELVRERAEEGLFYYTIRHG